jgi:amino acid transporter
MSEEIHDASSVVPRVMITTILLNGALGFGMLLAILFCLTDPTTTFKALSPFMTVIQASVGANGGANAMISIVIILAFSTLIAITTTSSRMTWSFARDRGLPGSSFLSTVSEPWLMVVVCTKTKSEF